MWGVQGPRPSTPNRLENTFQEHTEVSTISLFVSLLLGRCEHSGAIRLSDQQVFPSTIRLTQAILALGFLSSRRRGREKPFRLNAPAAG